MALTVIVTKRSVNLISPGLYDVNMTMVLTDDLVEVLNKNYSIRYCAEDVLTGKVEQLIDAMQIDINKYKAEILIYNAVAFDNAVITVQNGLVI